MRTQSATTEHDGGMEPLALVRILIAALVLGVVLVLVLRLVRARQQRVFVQRAMARASYDRLVAAHRALFGVTPITAAELAAWRTTYGDVELQAHDVTWCRALLPQDAADAIRRATELRDLTAAVQRHNARLAARRERVDVTPAPSVPKPLSYRRNTRCLTPAEQAFFRVLQRACPPEVLLWPKLRLADLFWTPEHDVDSRNRIDRKHVDVVLADARTLQPLCGIELDDRSHLRPDRQQRDQFVERVFEAAQLPLLREPCRAGYDEAALAQRVRAVLADAARSAEAGGAPACPTCHAPMVQRTSTQGVYAGQVFWGCTRYPQCRGVVRSADAAAPADTEPSR